MQRSIAHGMTFGLDEHVAAPAAAWLASQIVGGSYQQHYNSIINRLHSQESAFQEEHPYADWAGSLLGMVASPISKAAGPVYEALSAAKTSPFWAKAASLAGKAIFGAVEGGAAAGSMAHSPWDSQGIQHRLDEARVGAEWGAPLALAAPFIRGLRNTWRSFRPKSQVDRIAGDQVGEMAHATPQTQAPEAPRLPGMRFDAGSALNDPNVAANVRRFHETPRGATPGAELIADQGAAARQGYTAAGSTGMARPTASQVIVRAVRSAWDALRTEENRLWNVPDLRNLRPNLADLKRRIGAALDSLPYRDRAAIMGHGSLMNAIRDLAQMGPRDATLANINAARSDILKIARAIDDPAVSRAANAAAKAVLDSLEANPALKNNPAAADAYRRARAFTKMKWDTFGDKPFQDMVDTNAAGHYTANESTAAGKLFNFARGTASETIPGQMRRVIDTMDRMQRWWTTLQRAGTAAGDPNVAAQAKADLIEGARNYIVSHMMETAESVTMDMAGEHRVMWNQLARWIETNRDWIRRSGLFAKSQLDALEDLHHDATWAAKLDNLRAGKGSQTYQHLMQDPNIIKLFASPMFVRGIGLLGGLPGALLGRFNDAGIGLILGLGAENVGQKIMTSMYRVPIEQVRAKVEEALHDPQLLQDLRQPLSKMPSDRALAWVRSMLAAGIPGASASTDTLGKHPGARRH